MATSSSLSTVWLNALRQGHKLYKTDLDSYNLKFDDDASVYRAHKLRGLCIYCSSGHLSRLHCLVNRIKRHKVFSYNFKNTLLVSEP